MNDPEKRPRRRVKKVRGHGAHHGGAWKVAYADFVTAMMALFLVLWLVSQADTKLKQAIANYFRSPGVFDSMAGGVIDGPRKVSKEPSPLTSKDDEQALISAATMLRRKFETRPEFSKYKDQIKIEVTSEGLKIQIIDQAERVSFGSGSAELTGEAAAILAEIAHGICQLPNPILVGGHTDRRLFPDGSTYTNWELSTDRANAARRALEQSCVRPDQFRRIVGYADTDLFVPEDPYASANRRISITLLRIAGTGITAGGEASVQPGAGPGEKDQGGPAAAPEERPPPGNAPGEGATTRDVPAAAQSGERKGAVSVGEPDRVPANVRRTRESASPPGPPEE